VELKNDVSGIHQEAKRAGDIIKNMLAFARIHPSTRRQTDVNEILTVTLEMRAYEQNLAGIKIIRQFMPDLPRIKADTFQLQQVFLNIIINAEYFMKEAHNSGTLTVSTKMTDSRIEISIADDGPGISPEAMNHLFDPFFTTKPVGKGTGLGLSICHGIITEHGGRIFARNNPEKGAVFTIELPVDIPVT